MNKKIICLGFLVFCFGLGIGILNNQKIVVADDLVFEEQDATIRAIQKVKPAVVSIEITTERKVLKIDEDNGKGVSQVEKTKTGHGTGFLISEDGFIVTNKHVVNMGGAENSSYRVVLNSGKKYYAQLIGTDVLNDLAILKIFDKDLPFVEIGDSDSLQYGSSVIAIGNAMGKYQNSVTKGIVSGLGRNLVADDKNGGTEVLNNVIQTDAEINIGNSGGPLIDLWGRVVGINVAIDQAGTAIGFSIPINDVKVVIDSVKTNGRIIRARLGIRYVSLNAEIASDNDLEIKNGALIMEGEDGSPGVLEGSPAKKVGLRTGDIITEINAIELDEETTLSSIVQRFKPGNKIGLKIRRGDKTLIKEVVLDEFK